MLGRVHTSTNRVWVEQLLAFAAPFGLIWLSVEFPSYLPDWRRHVPGLTAVVACWLPALARTSSTRLGEVRLDGEHLVLPGVTGSRRIPLRRVRGAAFAPCASGAGEGTLVFRVAGFAAGRTVIVVEVDDAAAAVRLAETIRARAQLAPPLSIPVDNMGRAILALRVVVGLSVAAAYVLGGRAALGVMLAYFGLFIVHVARMHLMIPLRPQPGLWALLFDFPRAMRSLLFAHAGQVGEPVAPAREDPPLAEPNEPIADCLARLRVDLSDDSGAYRRSAEGLRETLSAALQRQDAPMGERALALRLLCDGDLATVRRRIAEMGVAEESVAPLEAVATAKTDRLAAKRLLRVPPRMPRAPRKNG